jgi:hypothetical protein
MTDFIRFVLRGGLGSAIAGATFTLLISMYYFGPFWEQLYMFHPLVLACFAVSGMIVGLVLWISTTLVPGRLTTILRIAIGMGVVLTTYLVFVFCVIFENGGRVDQIDWKQISFSLVVWLLLWITVTGGTAGFLSPSEKLFTRTAGLTYWDRVALYEIAEREASLATTRRAHSIGR